MIRTDMEILRDYVERGSEAAFVELLSRHIDLVFSVALRQTRDRHLAEEITQTVFIILARKADSLPANTVIPGWLCRTSRYVSSDVLKAHQRRLQREQEALMHSSQVESNAEGWQQVAALLEEGLSRLRKRDHDAVVLRFFEGKELKDVGAALGLSEDGARMRVNRAIAKLRAFYLQKGVTLSSGALSSAIAGNAVQSAPAGLAGIVASTVFSGASIMGAAVATTFHTVTMTTLQKVVVATTVAALAGLGVYEYHQATTLSTRLAAARRQHAEELNQWQSLGSELSNRLAFAMAELDRALKNDAELFRLRDEVTRLRKPKESAQPVSAEAEVPTPQTPPNIPPVRTLYSVAMVKAAWNQPIATGGWRTPSGKRALVIANASPAGSGQALSIKSHVVEYTDAAGAACGLDPFNTEDQAVHNAAPITTEQIEKLKGLDGVDFLTSPTVTTLSGRQARIQLTDEHQMPSGEKYSTGPTIDVIPTISTDGEGVQMIFSAHLNLKAQTEN